MRCGSHLHLAVSEQTIVDLGRYTSSYDAHHNVQNDEFHQSTTEAVNMLINIHQVLHIYVRGGHRLSYI